jgi:hypothetical protein
VLALAAVRYVDPTTPTRAYTGHVRVTPATGACSRSASHIRGGVHERPRAELEQKFAPPGAAGARQAPNVFSHSEGFDGKMDFSSPLFSSRCAGANWPAKAVK